MRRLGTCIRFAALCHLFTLALVLAACTTDDSGGSGGDTGGQEVGRDLGGPGADLGSGPDAGSDGGDDQGMADLGGDDQGQPDLGTPDLGGDDTSGEADVVTPACGALNEPCCSGDCDGTLVCESFTCVADTVACDPACLSPVPGSPGVTIVQQTGVPPTLTGGAIVDGDYELDLIELYTEGTTSVLVESFVITNNGDTTGAIVFDGPDWGFEANLDLFVDAVALSQSFAQTVQQAIDAGGCYTVVGNELQGDLLQCGASWPEGSEPPDSLGYEVFEGGIELLLVLTREMILAAVPEDDRTLAGLAIVGDLPVLLTFAELP